MPPETLPYLVVAVTGRALAASAFRAGRPVVVLDCFADRDTQTASLASRRITARHAIQFDRRALLAAARELAPPERCAGLVYGSGFEGRPGLLAQLAEGRRLLGNPPEVIRLVRDPRRFFPLLEALDIPFPQVSLRPPAEPEGWLVKHPGGAGGSRVRHADRRPVPAGSYWQRFEPGRVLSALFLADGRSSALIGVNEQWSSAVRPGSPFLYGGAVGGLRLPEPLGPELRLKLDSLVRAAGLVGLNGLDFLLREGQWRALEVNPRPTATMELYDADYPEGLFWRHIRACQGELPEGRAAPGSRAHQVIHAAAALEITGSFSFPDWCRDLPEPGTRFAPGDPVCTVHAAAADADQAVALLRQRQRALETALLAQAAAALAT
jgi:predicted ATP-grasp superfamily ATP-dependent carboligase